MRAIACAAMTSLLLGCGSPAEQATPKTPMPPWDFSGTSIAAKPDQAPTPAIATDFAATGSRCAERIRERLVVERDGQRLRDLSHAEALALDGAVRIDRGRHKDEPGLPLWSLLGDAEQIELIPCRGELMSWTRADLSAEPLRWVLVLSGKQTLKLLDRSDPSPKAAALKNLALVRLK